MLVKETETWKSVSQIYALNFTFLIYHNYLRKNYEYFLMKHINISKFHIFMFNSFYGNWLSI